MALPLARGEATLGARHHDSYCDHPQTPHKYSLCLFPPPSTRHALWTPNARTKLQPGGACRPIVTNHDEGEGQCGVVISVAFVSLGGGVANVDLVVGVFILRDAGCVLCHLHHSSFSGRVHSTHVYYQQPLNEQQEQFYRLGHHRIQHLRTKDKEKNVWWITGESSNR